VAASSTSITHPRAHGDRSPDVSRSRWTGASRRRVIDDDHVGSARAVYDASADRYVELVGTAVHEATEAPIDQALLLAFVELLKRRTGTLVADLGCGPGRVAALLAGHGLDVVGVDVSRAMLAHARAAHPAIAFGQGRLDALPIAAASLAGAVCWYSIIHLPPGALDPVLAELARVLEPGGQLLLAFQAGAGDPVHRLDAHGTGLALTSYRHGVDDVARRLRSAGFVVHATARREPELAHESAPQAFLFARLPERAGPTGTGARPGASHERAGITGPVPAAS
jgi:SAM-dependent methyltransferase